MPHQSVQELFSRTAARVPDHVAVARGELRVSYRELEERSNGIARFLLDAGVEKGTLVAILSGRAEETVAAILGVLKAGGVFVPLDPETPADRLRALLGQVEPGFFLVEPGLRGMLGDLVANARVACLGGELSAAACRTPERPEVVGGPDDMCYVYFTSGSTGTPKAIAGRLKGIDHFVRWETGTFGVGEGTRVSQFTSPAFDASLRDFFVPLCAGGTVCAPETRETLLDPAALVEWIDRERIELVHCVPSLFRSIVQQEPAPERFPALRHVLLAGEPLPPVDVRRWMDVFGERVELVNLYGPSETTMVKLFHRVTRADADRRSIPIGRPMEGARAVVVDERGRACPPGRVGEILIRTPYRTLGYYRQPELTAQVFVPNPFNPRQDPEDLVYRTGDLGRVLDDGSLEILGRRDHQIKLRGVRIEPGEVEHALRTHPAVRDVVVVDREDARGERLLCAYVVLAGPTPADALREHLSGRLPESMLPAVFVPLDRLPLTATGKVDRGALPAPAPAVHDFVAPRTATEEALARVWTETLGVERVGVHDSFFALGGYSLLAAQAVARVRDEFGIVLPLRALFDAPTVAGLAERVEAERAAAAGPAEAPIPRVPRDGAAPLPLSFAQERLWFLQQLDPADTTHNMAGALRLSGALDAAALEGALAGVVRRHETLRTRILTTPAGQAVQVIDPPAPVPLPLDDLAALPEGEREGEARRRIAAEVLRPFDLERGPLFRVRLLRLGEEEHVLAWTVHHIVSDGWSSGVLAREVSALYAVAVGAGAPELPELPVQYADYAAWQRERLPADAVERQLAWWREHLGGGLPNPELPRDRPAPAERTHAAAQEVVVLPRALGDRLAALGRAGDATPFMVLFAAFNALLHRYTGEDDLVAATAVAGRGFRELEGLIGFFVNTLALRTELSGDPTFRELVARVRATALAAFAHQEVPFQAVARALDPHGAGSEALTRVMFVHQHAAAGSELRLPGLEVRPFPVATGGESFDLTVWATDAPHGVLVQAQYPTDFYDAATVRRLLGHFATLLEAAAADPERRLSELPLLTAGEQAEREALNRTAAPYCDAPLHEQVEAQVRRTPDAVAVEWGGERLSYAELNRRANRLAHLLRARGVRPDGRVGLCLERSPEMAVAVLGILKAGAACVPLDPAYPRERLALMLEDAGAQLAVTSAALRDRLGSGVEALRVELDPAAPGATEDDPVSGASADTLLYVIFTSGSTGRPKAVAVPHRTLANLLAWQHAQPEYAVGARTLQFSTLSFDVAFQEIFSTWITGGTLVLIPEAVHRDAARWVPLLAAARVERLFCPFVALRQLAGWVDDGAPLPASLREAIPAGEQLQTTPALVRLFERLPGCRVHNMYGPSESHVVTAHTLEGDPSGWPALPPIGRPVWNTRVHVLDAHLQPVPVGIAGELYLGGDNLARGYLGRPDLTAERFLPDPFATAPGERLYRTGDRVRLRPDGAVDFLGRLDHQVKVRGFRVEPGEVEAVLALHPAVRGVVVTALPDAGAGRRLVAYTVPAEPVTVTELRAFLEERVPPYMVPSAFVFLERFPLLPSGKVDRRSLPDPEAARPALAQPYAPPRTPAEQVLAGVWSRLLGVDPVGIHDPFPELGGDSILAIQVVSQAHRAGMRITLQQLFELRTVAALAEVAAAVEPPAPGGERARSEEAGETVHPLSPMQQGILFHSLLAPDEAAYVEHVHCSYAGPFDAEAFRGAWGGLVERHPALRTTFAWEGVEAPLQVVHPHGELDLEVHDWRGRGEAARRDLAARVGAEDGRRYALDRLPLMHLSVFLLEDDSFDFVWSFHDIVLDGWSASAVLREFREGYDAAREGGAVELPEPLSFARYLEWLADQPLDAARAYWEGALAGLSAPTPLRSVLPAPAADESRGEAYRRHGLHLTPEATGRLLRGARRHGLTPNDLFQGAWGLLLSRYTGEREVLFGGVTAGRSAGPEGVETAVGVLVNTLPVRLRVRPEAPLSDWLTELQRSQREARAHEQIALYEIQRLAAAARFESILAFVNYPEDDAPGWRARRWSMQNVGYPLFVLARPGEQLYLEATFRTAELAGAAVERLLAHLATVLEGMGAALDGEAAVPLGRLPWLTAAEREHLLEEWNRTDAGLPEEGLAERFAAQAARTPEATAVVWGAERVSYRELERRAGLLARHLAEEGVGPETIVALLTERGLDFWTAALGVLLAGAAYLPLDPAHPPRRHRQVLEGSRTPLVLVAGALRPALEAAVAEMDAAARPCVRPLEDALAGPGPGGPLPAPPSPDGLAYVIFTSGSTGTPKGAMVEHRGMLNHLHAKVLELGLGRGDRVAQTASQCFDISVWQFLAPLLVGGEVHVLPDEVANDPAALAREVEARGITVLETVPSLMRTLVEELRSPGGAPVPLRALRWMIPTGEALPPELARDWLEAYPHVPLLNAYGPTECSDDVTHHPVHEPPAPGVRSVPIGRHLPNVRLYVVDAELDPVPEGVPGELLVGGVCVGRGYVHEPDRTADVFVPDPFGPTAGGRLYRTGDRVRLLPGGELEFLGRIDFQVKVRGFRIELGEIESVLAEHPAVRQAAVAARETGRGDRQLVAYLVAHPEGVPTAAELRAHVAASLPEYMVPAAWVELDALPLGANGKLDRRALPAPDEEPVRTGAVYIPPADGTEQGLAGIWAALLRTGPVGRGDNFFELGGDSILAIQVVARARQQGILLTPRDLLRHPTLAELAAAARPARRILAEQGPVTGEVRPTPIQRWLLEDPRPDRHHFNNAVLLRAEAPLSPAALARAAGALFRHHDALRLRFRHEPAGWRAWIDAPGGPAFAHVDLSGAAGTGEDAVRRAAAAMQRSLELEAGPLARVVLLDLGAGRPARVLLLVHHLAVDGVSWRILLEDLHTAYGQAAAGAEPRLPPKTTSFRSWAERLHAHAASPAVLGEAAYWREQSAPAGAPLPVDRPGGPDTVAQERTARVALGEAETRALLQATAGRGGTRVDEVLLAALLEAVCGWTGEDSLAVELEGHGRAELWDDVDLTRTVGWFTAEHPLRLERPASGDPGATLRAVRERLRAVPGDGIGWGLLRHVAPLDPEVEELRRRPRPEVLFNYLGQLDGTLPEESPFRPAAEDTGPQRSPRALRTHRIEVNAWVGEGRLHAGWSYGSGVHDAATIERVAQAFLGALRALVEGAGRDEPAFAPEERAGSGPDEAERPPLRPMRRRGALPLSFAQQRIWFLHQLDPGSPAYNMAFPLRMRGILDVGVLARALAEVVRRHESLRTRFHAVEGEPVQVVDPAEPRVLPVVDLRGTREREGVALRLAEAEARRPFDLEQGPLLRTTLLRAGEEDWVLLFTLHHIVGDAWTTGVLVREVSALYTAYAAGRPSPLPELEVQYADFALWQRAWLTGEVLERQLGYWTERLSGAPPLLELPTARPRTDTPLVRSGVQTWTLPGGPAGALRALARREGATLFVVLLAGWQALLARYSGQTDVVVGVPVAGRSEPELEGLVGFFLNTLALRTDLSGDPAFREVTARVQEAMVGVYAHQDLPFERLLEALPVERSLGWTPVFQAMFNLINVPETPLSIPGLEVESLPAGGISSRSDVTLHAVEREEEIHFTLAYDAGLFEAEQMVEMLGHLEALLEAVAADPTLRLSALPLRPGRPSRPHGAAERVRPAGPFVEFPRAEIEQSIDRRFARQARVHGERLAMSGGGVRLTYAELDAAVDRVARAILAERGAGEERIGILLGHDAAMPVAVLAALRAGKTYVPLDPRYPEERLALVLADARPGALLTDAQNLASARRLAGDLPLLRIDAPGRVHGGSLPEVPPDRPAYILYTSGSTGRPKGVVQSHRNVLHHVRAYTNNLRIGPADRLTLFSSFAFDAAVMDIFGALLNGAALCPLDLRAEGSDDLARWLEREGITVFHSTPTVFRYLLRDRHEPGSIPGIRLVVLGGEEAGRGEVELFLRHFGEGCVLVNGLGPTESTLALQALLDREAALRGGPVPVGFPVEDTEVALVNAAGEQPAVYGTGEIVIRSAHVALGYWNRPDATRAAFRPGPEGDGRRAYHTGDLGRWLPDGSVQFLGRADHQVKVRGYRIEPGEVEAALLEHPEVREAAVTARPDPDGERQLVAYVVAQEGAAPGQAALRAHLRARLPEFMVPAAVVRVEALPRTPSGKTDRLALPDPEWGGRAARGQYRAPATPTEQMVAGLWAELLGLERVGADDDFFEVGGHSLRAMQAVSRLRAALGIELPVRVLFEAPTLAALAARVDAARAGGEGSPLPQIRPVSRDPRGALPLSFAQQRLWFLQQLHPGDTSYNLGGALRLTGVLDVAALEGALAGVVRRHEALRTRILTTAAGEGVQVVDPPAPVPLPLDDLAPLPEAERRDEARRRIAAAARQPFDLERGPMFRVRLLRLDRHEHVLAWTVHHVVSDAWSSGVLAREVSALYAAAAEGAAPELPELPVQYADYAAWQREHLSGEVLEAQLAHWRRELEGAPAALLLPTDRPRRPAAGFTGASESMVLPPALADRLARLAREEGATPFMALLAAWAALLARYAGEEDVVVGTPTAGRTRPELEGLIGFFVNTLAIRVDLSRDPGFRALLGRVRGTALGAFEHQELPFERLVDELGTERDLGRHPVFQVMFALQNAPEGALRLAGLTLAPLETGAAATPFELSLALREGPDGILAELLYAADLFEAATAQRMLGHYRALLERAAAEPDSPVAVLPLLAPAEREQLLEEWNGVPAPDAAGLSVVEMVWAQAARAPGATAVVLGERSLSYAELVGRADRLARRLRRWGAGPENRVAVLLDRSLELPVALLGTLRAGAAYVPVDPALPPERVSFLLEDTAAAAVITRADLRARLPETGAPVLHLEEGAEGGGDAAPLPAVDPASLAYVIHTSGSTGTPKGAMVEHRALAAFALAMGARLGLGPGDRMLQFAALGFDVVVEELFPAWTHGAAVVLHEADLLDAPEELLRVVERRGVTGLELPTAYWHEWVRALALAGERLPAHVRFVIIGGERVSPERLAEWARLGVPLVHVYGLTETTVTTTTLDLPAGDDGSAWSSLPIGRPVPGARVYLLDPHLDPVPVGVPGELCVGGAGVGRGYLGRPSLTAGRWVPDPFAAEAGARMYRTGDLARWLADGTIEFLGRTDHQVKVRGFRVEPGEVEAALLARPEVREAVVAARPAPGGGARLVGWLVPAEGYSPAPDALVRRPVRPELWPSHGEYPVYDDLLYRAMAEDGRRNAAYREALAEVAPGAVVLDVGTGGEAVLARLAVEAGARRVYAVEAMEASFRQARERVRELGLEDRIVVLHGDAATVEVPEPVDVCVSELLGCVGSSEGAVAALDSVRRWLKPEGAMVPRRCVTRIAAARLPDELHAAPALEELGGHYAGEVFGVVGHRFDLRLCVRNLPADHLLSPSAPFEELDFARPGGDEWEHEVELAVARGGRLDGFVAWIQLYAGERLGVDALEQESAWLPMFFPAFYPGVEVRAGDTLRVRCQSRLSDDGVHPDYRVSGVLHRPGRGDVPFAHHSVHHGPAAYPSPLHREVFGGEGARTRPAEAAERVGWGELRAALGEVLPGHMVPDALVALESLPLTRHGKLDRRALPDPEPSAAAGAYRAPEDATGATLAGIWATVLGLERVGADDNFFALGGDSILSIQVVARARAAGVRITPRQIFEHPTVAALARAARESAPAARGEGGSAVGEAPLTPVQRWFFEQEIPDRHHWNVAALLEPRERLDAAVLEGAVAALLEHHDALRARFAPAGEGWRQEIAAAADGVPVVRLDLAGLPEAEQGGALERAAAELQAALRLERGPLLRAALFERGEGRTQRVLLVVHHLVMDGVSWRVLMEDLEAACDALSRGVRPALPPRTTSWRHWAERLAAHADAPEVRAQAGFWTAAVRDLPPPLPLDFRRGPNLEGTVESVAVSLDPEETRALLQEVPPVYRTRVDEVLLAALARAFASWTGDARLRVELEGHGREELFPDVDLSRTVGWFTTQYPVLLDLRGAPGEGDALRAVKEQLRAVPGRGIGYGLLRYLSSDPELRAALGAARPPEVAFNYLGQFRDAAAGDGLFARAAEPTGPQSSPRTPRTHALTVGALVADDRLRAWFSYSPDLHERGTVEAVAGRFAAELRGVIEHCRAPGAGGYTPSDFTAVRLDQRSLDKILLQVKG